MVLNAFLKVLNYIMDVDAPPVSSIEFESAVMGICVDMVISGQLFTGPYDPRLSNICGVIGGRNYMRVNGLAYTTTRNLAELVRHLTCCFSYPQLWSEVI